MSPESEGTYPESRYRTVDEIGGNGPVRVLAAHDELLNRSVAIAVCDGTSAERSDFTSQGQTVARLTSKFLVDIYDSGSFLGHPFVVFERPSFTLTDMIGAGDQDGTARISLTDAARGLEEAMACLRLAGVEVGGLRPEIVGLNEAGDVKLSPWPFGPSVDAGAAGDADDVAPQGGAALSDAEQIVALLAPGVAGSPEDAAALRRFLEQPRETVYSAGLVSAWNVARVDRTPPDETSSDPITAPVTAPVMVESGLLSRPAITSHLAKGRRPRTRYLAAAAAAIVVVATLGAVTFFQVQSGTAGTKGAHAGGASTSGSSRHSHDHTATTLPPAPAFGAPTNDPTTSDSVPPAAPLVVPAANAVNTTAGPVVGTPTTTTTTTTPKKTKPPVTTTTTTTTVPDTTTTTVPETTTTTTTTIPPGP